jgi:uncharacterized membrane protein
MQWNNGAADKAALYALRDVSTGDTADLAQDFLAVKQAVMLGTTVNGSAVASVSGTVVTMPAGLSSDAAYLLAWGDSA